ncbi:acetyltransferase [Accumulibacter sp.]|uniref:acetyltransferase n=1 Tax=Accumulibacter sp. TaxID=2053492 RepID=UPI0035B16431
MKDPTSRPVVIFGAGELAQLAHYYFTHDSTRQVAGFTVDAKYIDAPDYLGLPLVPSESLESSFPPERYDMFVAIGYNGLNSVRAKKCGEVVSRGYRLATYISSRASVWSDLKIGENCLIMEGNVIQPFVKIGHGVIMFCSSVISHHVEIGDYCFIGAEASLSGGVKVGANTFIGVNATIREHLIVGRDCIIGAGTLIMKNTVDGSGYLVAGTSDSGIPSRRLRSLL